MSPLRLIKTPKFKKTKNRLSNLKSIQFDTIFHEFGKKGVAVLSQSTPVDSGETSKLWDYSVTKRGDNYRLSFFNTNMAGGVPLVILLQYGHGTRNGGFVFGKNFINPALEPIYKGLRSRIISEVKP